MAKKKEVKESEGLKSISLDVENFKNIDKFHINIGGRSFLFFAKNAGGKSTLIQAMMSPMDKKVLPSEPIKQGEERARVTHKIGGMINGLYQEYTMDLYFTPGDKSGRLSITNEKGEAMKSPSTMIKSIIGNISFDVTGWLHDTKAKKLETIKTLTGKGVEIDVINKKIKDIKEDIKFKKAKASDLEGSINNHEFTPEEVEIYSAEVDIKSIQEEMNAIAKNQETWDGINNKIEGFKKDLLTSENNLIKANKEIERLHQAIKDQEVLIDSEKTNIDKLEKNIKNGKAWIEKTVRPSVEEVNKRLNEAVIHNQKFERIGRLQEQRRDMISTRQLIDVKQNDIDNLEAERSEIISSSQLPVKGLKFTDEEILLDGIPLEEGQVNTAKLMEISIDIAIALNPNLKIIFIKDGNAFDKANLEKIVNKIEDAGYMAVIEMVSYEGDELEVKFTEQEFK